MTTHHLTSDRAPSPVTGLTATGRLAAIDLTWKPYDGGLVDHYEVYASQDPAARPSEATLLTRTLYPHLAHATLGPQAVTWYYSIVTVVASGARSRASRAVSATTTPSVSTGTPLAQVGTFDHKGLEFALSPNLSSKYLTTFPHDVDFTYGSSTAARDWSYLHPGPSDSWAGRRQHTFTLRFTLDAAPTRPVGFALWLTDAHATLAGTADLAVNGATATRLTFTGGATKGSLEGDATRPGSPLKPSFYELALDAALFTAGENTLTLTKTAGSWIAYDALGLFQSS
ncbi:polysaccharide lyase family protein [Streptomyces sp. NPDC094034]|uniref:polysaccharide lyase family protein n=1 Tax=Streptomyces sp. NPDC094034 TaxID=3155309 RepID=UPI003325EC4E